MTSKTNPTTPAELMRAHVIAAANWPNRIDRALTQLRRASNPAHQRGGNGGGRPKNAISDPTGTQATNDVDPTIAEAHDAYLALTEALGNIEAQSRRVERILDAWAPQAKKGGPGDTENAALWCANHRRHDRRTPRAEDGSIHCDWCATTLRKYGALPNMALIQLHDQGSRIFDNVYRKELTKAGATPTAKTKRGEGRRARLMRLYGEARGGAA